MNKIVFTLIFFWVLWKVLKSVLEEIRKRMENQGPVERESISEEAAQQRQEQLRASQPESHQPVPMPEPQEWRQGEPIPGEEEIELERWFREALEHKQQAEDTAVAAPPARDRVPSEPARPQAAQPRVARPRAPAPRVEPPAEHRRETRVERRRVVAPRGPAVPEPEAKRREAPPAAGGRRKRQERLERGAGRKPAFAELAGIADLDLHDIRRGIILAEILGPPKGLSDVDSHVI